jgi:hypothetical protein
MSSNPFTRRDLLRLGLAAGTVSSLGLGAATGEETPTPSPASAPSLSNYLDTAVRAARWIHSARIETPQGVIWMTGPERPEGFDSVSHLYSGGAGVLLFLLELARATGEKAYREEAAAGADALIGALPAKADPR